VHVKLSSRQEGAKANDDTVLEEKRKAGRPKKGDGVEKKKRRLVRSKPRTTGGVGSRMRSRAT